MEVDHSTIIELKVGQRVKKADIDQLMKYVRAKKACGMALKNAADCRAKLDLVESRLHTLAFKIASSA